MVSADANYSAPSSAAVANTGLPRRLTFLPRGDVSVDEAAPALGFFPPGHPFGCWQVFGRAVNSNLRTKIFGPDFVPVRNGPADVFHARYPGLIDGCARKFEVLYEARA